MKQVANTGWFHGNVDTFSSLYFNPAFYPLPRKIKVVEKSIIVYNCGKEAFANKDFVVPQFPIFAKSLSQHHPDGGTT